MKSLYLIDGMAVLFRGYYALLNAGLTAKDGEPTGGTFAFISTLERLIESNKPDHIAIAWDRPEPTFRHKAYPEYKANRSEFPEDLVPQLQRVKKLVDLYHIPSIELAGYEADDLIGTLARRGEEAGFEVHCVTPDKDYLQLVTERVKVLKPSRPGQPIELVDIEGVKEKFGVAPAQVIDVLALMGDSSDNIPGVKGIGEKTAIPLIQEFGTVEGIYQNIASVAKKGARKKLQENEAMALLSKELVTIDTDSPIDVDFDDLTLDEPDVHGLIRAFEHLGFTSLIKRYDEDGAIRAEMPEEVIDDENRIDDISSDEHEYHTIDTLEELDQLLSGPLSGVTELCYDLETDSTDEMRAQILGIALSDRPSRAWYIPIRTTITKLVDSAGETLFDEGPTEEKITSEGLARTDVLKRLTPILVNPEVRKIAQNGKFDGLILRRHGVDVTPLSFDTMLAAYVLDSTESVGMDALSRKYLNYAPVPITELIGPKGKNQSSLVEIPVPEVASYACEDADITIRLKEVLSKRLEEESLQSVAETYEFPLVSALIRMESAGVALDTEALAEISDQLGERMDELEAEIYELAGHEFTINSPKQLQVVLFDELGLPTKKKTKTGYSTDQFVLEELSVLHDLPQKILDFRGAAKLKSTYVDALPALINPETGRVHTSYNQAVTSTGRLSSNNPNLQNIPIRSEVGREIRKAFIPGMENGALVAADYSQIELRIMAHICKDPAMIEAFSTGFDIHTATAMRVFDVTADEVVPNMRRKAKEVNFGIMYGIGPFGLARRLKMENDEAKDLIATYFESYPGVREYINGILQQLRDTGYVETLSGRRRHYGNPDELRNPRRGMVERAAINMPIQGTAADIIKLAMINIDRELDRHFPDAEMLLQVHDELIFEVPKEQAEELASWVTEKMESAFSLGDVKLEVEAGIGDNWFEAH